MKGKRRPKGNPNSKGKRRLKGNPNLKGKKRPKGNPNQKGKKSYKILQSKYYLSNIIMVNY